MSTAFRKFLMRLKRSRRLGSIGIAILMVGAMVAFVAPELSGAMVSGSPSNFESNDGNLTVQTSGNTDWNCLLGAGAVSDPAGPTCKAGVSTANLVVKHPGATEAATGGSEVAWKPGQK